METMTPPALTIKAASDYLNVSQGTIYNLLKSGQLKRIKIGRRTLISRIELDKFLSANER